MLRSILVGVDGSEYRTAAVELGIQWAQRSGAVLVGLGIIDAPTICKPEPVPLGGSAYKVHHDASLLADATHKVGQFLEHCARRCAEADVACQILQDIGLPTERILLEAQRYDLIMLGQSAWHLREMGDVSRRIIANNYDSVVTAQDMVVPWHAHVDRAEQRVPQSLAVLCDAGEEPSP
jgi:nucleotide-binding universal stress UspA family protein